MYIVEMGLCDDCYSDDTRMFRVLSFPCVVCAFYSSCLYFMGFYLPSALDSDVAAVCFHRSRVVGVCTFRGALTCSTLRILCMVYSFDADDVVCGTGRV